MPDDMLSQAAGPHHFAAVFDVFAELNHNDVITVALTLGVLLFAVTTSILLVRTRLRAAAANRTSTMRLSHSKPSATAPMRS